MVEQSPVSIPVIFADRPGFETVSGAYKSPVIEIGLGYDIRAFQTGQLVRGSKIFRVRALMDTGADDFFVDAKLLDEMNAPFTDDVAEIRTAHQVSSARKRKVHMFISEFGHCSEIDVIPMNFSDGTRAYQAVFGLRFMEIGKLTIDMRGKSQFTMHPPVTQVGLDVQKIS
ncbi:hypothetical protein OK142_00080 [Agrobacterium sp. BT-220-3]|nr:hypothetical protein [Agrobacterium sp. BT-220-3]